VLQQTHRRFGRALSRLRPAAPFALLAGAAVLLCSPRAAYAQNPAAAEALFEQARAAMAAGSLDIACARFRDSDKLDPALGTRFNLADCEERRGRVATAWSLFRGVLSELARDDDRRPIAEARARALEPRLPQLTLRRASDTPEGVRVRIDGVELGEGSFGVPLPMDPGPHDLQVLLPGESREHTRQFTLKEGERAELPISFASEPAEVAQAPRPDSGVSRRSWGYAAGSVGVAGIALGAVTGVVTLNKKSTADANCDEERERCNRAGVDANESGKTYGTLSGISFGIGIVGLVAGAYLLLTADEPSAAHSSSPWRSSVPSAQIAKQQEAAVVSLRPALSFNARSGFVSLAGSF
jgi:hypothetical protein